MNKKPDVYENVTNAIIKAIEEGQTADKVPNALDWSTNHTNQCNHKKDV